MRKNKRLRIKLVDLARHGDSEKVEGLISRFPILTVNSQNLEGHTPLMAAAEFGHTELMLKLVSLGAEVDKITSIMRTALMFAAANGQDAAVKVLISNGASINARSEHGLSALMYAVKHDHPEIAMTLIQAGADVSIRDNSGKTAYDIAQSSQNVQMAAIFPKSELRQGSDALARLRRNMK